MGDRQLAAVRNREIGFVMQDFALVAQEDVLFNVMLPLYFSQTKHSRMKDLAAEKLERVGLSRPDREKGFTAFRRSEAARCHRAGTRCGKRDHSRRRADRRA